MFFMFIVLFMSKDSSRMDGSSQTSIALISSVEGTLPLTLSSPFTTSL